MSKLFCCQVAAGSGTDGADDGGLVAACRDGDPGAAADDVGVRCFA